MYVIACMLLPFCLKTAKSGGRMVFRHAENLEILVASFDPRQAADQKKIPFHGSRHMYLNYV